MKYLFFCSFLFLFISCKKDKSNLFEGTFSTSQFFIYKDSIEVNRVNIENDKVTFTNTINTSNPSVTFTLNKITDSEGSLFYKNSTMYTFDISNGSMNQLPYLNQGDFHYSRIFTLNKVDSYLKLSIKSDTSEQIIFFN